MPPLAAAAFPPHWTFSHVRPLGLLEDGGILAEATLTAPTDTDLTDLRDRLTQLYYDFCFHNPGVREVELSVTFNFILRGEGAGGSPTYSVFWGGDFTTAGNDLSTSEVLTLRTVGDLDLLELDDLRESEAIRQLERNFEDSGVVVERICSYVFILRAYRENEGDHGRVGRQIALQVPD